MSSPCYLSPDNEDLSWNIRAVFDYANNTTLKVAGTGSGGVSEAAKALKDDQCAYGFVKLTYPGGDDTTRTKFVFFSWAAPKAKALVKGKMSVHKASIKSIIQDFRYEIDWFDCVAKEKRKRKKKFTSFYNSLELNATTLEELDEATLIDRVKKANY